MIFHSINESIVEDAALSWFGELCYVIDYGSQIVILRDSLLPKLLSGELGVANERMASVESKCRSA